MGKSILALDEKKEESKIKLVKCESTGEPLLEVSMGKITTLADCDIQVRDGEIKAYKKGELVITLPSKTDTAMAAIFKAHYER